ncbi:hypothetical protein PHLCEN_2v1807 [Hermanssonia centrifuga]|uniref:Uncharacterized protein n=1 Tax=Hermanssonia centrifuga TaxID=98765 RepID=A0A2R6RVV1_9APHY|nr:hypothetical protein PHLCEN_2v1807 [Hermanssonia centrifuga]
MVVRQPLPDERPRASVANLIGRFEQQTKRQSLSSVPPRTASALSNVVGDTAKEEIKDKREWPPKPKQTETETEPVFAEASVSNSAPSKPSLPTPDASPKADPVRLLSPPPVADARPEPREIPEAVSSESVESVSPPPAARPPPSRQSSGGAPTGNARKIPTTPSKSKVPASRAPVAPKPTRTPAKSPPTSYHGPSFVPPSASKPTTQPLRASASAKLAQPTSRPSSSASMRAPITPARSKTPSTARPKTPSSAARPKTPGSGLFAPTAASLAKARNVPEPPTGSAKKPTLSSEVADRLSKPTASSISKAKPGATVTSPPRVTPAKRGAAPTRGTAPARGTTVKPRVGLAGAKLREKAGAKSAAPSNVPVPTAEIVDLHDELSLDEVHQDRDAEVLSEPEQEHNAAEVNILLHEALVHEPEEHEHGVEVGGDAEIDYDEGLAHEEHEDASAESTATSSVHDDASVEPEVESIDPATINHAQDGEDDEPEIPASPSPTKAIPGEDLVDLLNMLEAKKPVSDDIAGEIPDEE